MKKSKLILKRETLRALTGQALTQAMGAQRAGTGSEGAACPQTAFPPCGSVAGACSGIPYTCTVWTLNTCNVPCTNASCACQWSYTC